MLHVIWVFDACVVQKYARCYVAIVCYWAELQCHDVHTEYQEYPFIGSGLLADTGG